MRILMAEDDLTSRLVLEAMLATWGHEVTVACDGDEAWAALRAESAPGLAILDWMMPGLDGVEVCRRVRQQNLAVQPYLILLTSRSETADLVSALTAGADDYVTKPFDKEELSARIRVGERMVALQTTLAHRVEELQEALAHVRTLQGLLPICMHCNKIRADQQSWQRIDHYLSLHTDVRFTHGICPECLATHWPKFRT